MVTCGGALCCGPLLDCECTVLCCSVRVQHAANFSARRFGLGRYVVWLSVGIFVLAVYLRLDNLKLTFVKADKTSIWILFLLFLSTSCIDLTY